MRKAPSPNFNARRPLPDGGPQLRFLVLHYTEMAGAEAALARLGDPAAEVSAHYLIGEEGTIWQLVEEDRRAWHAGRSFWRGITDINSASIGIELDHPGHALGYHPFAPAQIAALIPLARAIMARWNIPPAGLLAHSDIAPTRKRDPGELFPWAELAAAGVGLWPEATFDDPRPVEGEALAQALSAFGYDISEPDAALTAFRRRWAPVRLGRPACQGDLDLARWLVAAAA